jgi:hypothetical protein
VPAFGAPAAVYFANLLANERDPAAAAESCAELPPPDQAYLGALGMETEFASWRAVAATVEAP